MKKKNGIRFGQREVSKKERFHNMYKMIQSLLFPGASENRAKNLLDLIHTDVLDLIHTEMFSWRSGIFF